MKKIGVICAILFMLILPPLASSKIIFEEQPEDIYNLDDVVGVNVSVDRENAASDYLEAFLICEGDEELIYKHYYEDREKFSLWIDSIANERGDCNIEIKFGDEEGESNEFEISDQVDVSFEVNDKFLLPLEELEIEGEAVKENGKDLDGLAEIEVEDIFKQTVDVSEGEFYFKKGLSKTTPPGTYEVMVRAYEETKNDFINEGQKVKEIEVDSRPTYIEIGGNETVSPPQNFKAKITLLDQVKEKVENESILVKVLDPVNNLVLEEKIGSGQNLSLEFESNATRKGWKINCYHGDIFSSETIFVKKNEELDTQILEGGKIKITNVGNIKYEGVVDIVVENGSFNHNDTINLNLSIGESKRETLQVEGKYNVSVGDKTFSNVILTGASIAPSFSLNPSTYLWVFLLIILLGGGYLLFRYREKIKERIPKLNLISGRGIKKHKKSGVSKKLKKSGKGNYKVYSTLIKSRSGKTGKIKRLLRKEKYKLHKINERLSFILLYSEEDKEKELIRLAKKIKNKVDGVSIVINSEEFKKKIKSIRASLSPRKIIDKVEGVFVTKNIYEKVKGNYNLKKEGSHKAGDKIVTLYRIL